jgi:hypothetical protein
MRIRNKCTETVFNLVDIMQYIISMLILIVTYLSREQTFRHELFVKERV